MNIKKIKHSRPYAALLREYAGACEKLFAGADPGCVTVNNGRTVDAVAYRALVALGDTFSERAHVLIETRFEDCAVEALQTFAGDELLALRWLGLNVHTDRQPGLVYVPAFGSRGGKGSFQPAYRAAIVRCGADPSESVTRACPR